MDYVIVIHEAEEGGYWADFPALPGCYTQGETIEEVLEASPDAVSSHLDALREFGQDIPFNGRVVITSIRCSAESAAQELAKG